MGVYTMVLHSWKHAVGSVWHDGLLCHFDRSEETDHLEHPQDFNYLHHAIATVSTHSRLQVHTRLGNTRKDYCKIEAISLRAMPPLSDKYISLRIVGHHVHGTNNTRNN